MSTLIAVSPVHVPLHSAEFTRWAAPLDTPIFNLIPGAVWLLGKVLCVLFLFLWFRATFPRYRYDQIMRLGWKVLIPVTIVWIGVEMVMAWYKVGPWAKVALWAQ